MPSVPGAALTWQRDLDSAILGAAAEYRPVLIFATMPGCGYCDRMRVAMQADTNIVAQLQQFALAEIDVTQARSTAQTLQIRGTPTLIFLSSDGRERGRLEGFLPPDALKRALASVLDARAPEPDTARREALAALEAGRVPPEKWPEIIRALGQTEGRREIGERIRALRPFPRRDVVALLESPHLAVRIGALELLEEAAGDDYQFDPWQGAPERGVSEALAKWKAWAEQVAPTNAPVFSGLTREAVTAYINDVISENSDRSRRAMRLLEQGGDAVAPALDAFLRDHPGLPAGTVLRIREVKYAVLLPPRSGFDPAMCAHRLVFGNLDTQLQSLRELGSCGAAAQPIVDDFLLHPNSLLRETAVETLVAVGGRDAMPRLQEVVRTEKDREVVIAAARALGTLKSKRGLAILTELARNPDEDIVIAALESIAKLRSRAPAQDLAGCLKDPRWRVRAAALQTVGELTLKDVGPEVEKRLSDPDPFVRYKAVLTLPQVMEKEAGSRLEKVFLADDDLKAPVVAAFCAMEIPLPASFAPALKGKDSAILLAVLDGLAKRSESGLPLAAELAAHPDGDVACAALRVLASSGMKLPRYVGIVTDALRSGGREKTLAVLQSLSIERGSDDEFVEGLGIAFELPPGAAPEAVTGAVADLLSAFDQPPAPPAATNAVAAPAAASLTDLLEAFEGGTAAPSGTVRQASGGLAELETVLRSCCQTNSDPEIRRGASVQLVRMGRTDSLPYLREQKDQLTADVRCTLANALRKIRRPEALAVLRDLLADSSGRVRTDAAEAAAANMDLAPWADALFGELTRAGTLLKPSDVPSWSLRNAMQKPSARQNARRWADTLLAATGRTDLVNFAIVLVEGTWKKGDIDVIRPFAAAANPYTRRAALHALAACDKSGWSAWMETCLKDPSEHVRLIVPAMLNREDRTWVHYFDAGQMSESSFVRYTDGRSRSRLKDDERQALLKLAGDPSVAVRIESQLALLAAGEDFDAGALRAAVESVADKKTVGRRVAEALASNTRKLDARHAALLPLLEYGTLDEKRKEAIYAQVTEEGSGGATGVVFRAAPAAAPRGAAETGGAPPAALPSAIRLVFFSEDGCENCARTREALNILKETMPELVVTELEIHSVNGRRLNGELCERFSVPDRLRGLTPTIFAGAGYLSDEQIDIDRLAALAIQSLGLPFEFETALTPATATPVKPAARRPAPALPAPPQRGKGNGRMMMAVAMVLAAGLLLALRRARRFRG